ncbi:MAG: SPASM domain-containing protein, partial [Candidatus Thermoplasmatota archaeon]|nr:SPASM domain-containing protein [Candidatus Thermoplasmatota archaeon]
QWLDILYNYQHLTEIVDFFSNLGVGISFNIILDKLGRSYSVDDPTALSKALFSAFSRASELGILEDRIGRRRAEPFFTEIPRLYDCPAYGQQIFFSPKGTLGPCQAFYTTELYQEKITPDFDAKKSDVLYPFIKMGGPFKSDYCTECPAIGICGGSCPYDVYTITGKLGFIDPYFCSIMKETLNNLIGYYYKQKVKSQ